MAHKVYPHEITLKNIAKNVTKYYGCGSIIGDIFLFILLNLSHFFLDHWIIIQRSINHLPKMSPCAALKPATIYLPLPSAGPSAAATQS